MEASVTTHWQTCLLMFMVIVTTCLDWPCLIKISQSIDTEASLHHSQRSFFEVERLKLSFAVLLLIYAKSHADLAH